MNLPTLLLAAAVALILAAIAARGIHNRRHHRGGCACGCESCPGRDLCHPK